MLNLGYYLGIFRLLRSKGGLFIQIILMKWYFLVMVPAVYITYVVFKTLHDKGIFQMVEGFISTQLAMLMEVATRCTQHILNLNAFIECL